MGCWCFGRQEAVEPPTPPKMSELFKLPRETIPVACYAVSAVVEGIVTLKPDDLSLRFGKDLPSFDVVRWDDARETYVFVVHQQVNVELICSDLGYECVRITEGRLCACEYNSSFRVDSATLCSEDRTDRRNSSGSTGRLFSLRFKGPGL